MGIKTEIEWCDSTINGTSGCDGCELYNPRTPESAVCYAKWLHETRLSKSIPAKYAAQFSEVRMIPGRFAQAAAWSDLIGTDRPGKPWLNGFPRIIFVGDLGDTFSDAVTDDFLERELLGAIRSKAGERHLWLLLTKRPSRLAALSKQWGGLPPNVVAMTTLTSQAHMAYRVSALLNVQCGTRVLSCEPMRSPLNLKVALGQISLDGSYFKTTGIHGVICGGASGRNASVLPAAWVRYLQAQCFDSRTPFFFKQWGTWLPAAQVPPLRPEQVKGVQTVDGIDYLQLDKRIAGSRLDGHQYKAMFRDPTEVPF
jgi:protein gp37